MMKLIFEETADVPIFSYILAFILAQLPIPFICKTN